MTIVLSGGGTGGHLFPGVALAEAFLELDKEVRIVFVGARRGLEARLIPRLGYQLLTLPVSGVTGAGPLRRVSGALSLLLGTVRMVFLFPRLRPVLVVGLGGYASVPAVLAARLFRVPASLLEQNVVPGRANRLLARFVQKVYLGFPPERDPFPPGKAEVTGNPIRRIALPGERRKEGRGPTLLILGGSQGARRLNDAAMEAIPRLLKRLPRLRVIHQTGARDEERVRELYLRERVEAEVTPFLEEMGRAYAEADLCLSRSGALSVSEMAAAGVPALLVPYPHALSHQRANALWMAEQGGAWVLPPEKLTGANLGESLFALLSHPEVLARMAEAARSAGRREAARTIAGKELARAREARPW